MKLISNLILIIFLSANFVGLSQNSRKLYNKNPSLIVKLKPLKKRVKRKHDTLVEIIIKNETNYDFKIKPHLNLGYKDGVDIDLFFEIAYDNKVYDEYYKYRNEWDYLHIDYTDYKLLKPKDKISYKYEIQELYPLLYKGKYKIRVGYDPKNDKHNELNQIPMDIIYSDWVELIVD